MEDSALAPIVLSAALSQFILQRVCVCVCVSLRWKPRLEVSNQTFHTFFFLRRVAKSEFCI